MATGTFTTLVTRGTHTLTQLEMWDSFDRVAVVNDLCSLRYGDEGNQGLSPDHEDLQVEMLLAK